MVRPQMSQHQRRQQDGEEQESRWRSDWGTHLGRSATDKDWLARTMVSRGSQISSDAGLACSIRADTGVHPPARNSCTSHTIAESPFEEEAVTRLKEQVVRSLAEQGLHLNLP